MHKYLARRLLVLLPTVIGLSIIIFLLMRVMPGDVARMILVGPEGEGTYDEAAYQALQNELGLNRPIYVQYLDWSWRLLNLDAGRSLRYNRPVAQEIVSRFPVTLELALLTTLISLTVGIPLGVLSAIRQNRLSDYAARIISIAGLTAPPFWIATLVVLGLVLFTGWMPPVIFSRLTDDPGANLSQMIWPALVLGYNHAALLSRMTRSCTLEVLRQEYIRTARAKGLVERVVISRHTLRNALIPVITVFGFQFGHMLGGSVIQETIFGIPGLGKGLVDAVFYRDYPTVQGFIVTFGVALIVVNLITDLVYGWLDPRVQLR
ncbi:MAG: ABC transporter permease [Chloroflexota bacterium]